MEETLFLEEVDPQSFYGTQNANIDRIAAKMPQLQITFRGRKITAKGKADDLAQFRLRTERAIAYLSRYGHLSPQVIDQIFDAVSYEGSKMQPAKEKTGAAADKDFILTGENGMVIKARTPGQREMVSAIQQNDMLFAVGPAGSGKTYTAIALAVKALREKVVKKVILTRPAVEAGERLGFLPGDLKEKLDPYLQPLYDALHDMIPAKKLEAYIEMGIIEIAPLAYMRGRTLDNAFVILDEAQNTTLLQLKMFLTRMGRNAKFIVTGDATQIDLPRKSDSGLLRGLEIIGEVEGISIITMQDEDIIRHPLVKKIVHAFEKADQPENH